MTSYFLGPRLLGQSPEIPWWSDTQLCVGSDAYLCPTCGELWGRVHVEGKDWFPLRRGCSLHPWIEEVGGTFIHPWCRSDTQLRALPPEVLAYEFLIRYNLWSKNDRHHLPEAR